MTSSSALRQSSRLGLAVEEVIEEYHKARSKHPALRGPHEGYAVIKEEVDEFWDEVKANNPRLARKEIIQVAAMALAYLIEVSPWPSAEAESIAPTAGSI